MNCGDALRRLSERTALDDELRDHVSTCENCRPLTTWEVADVPDAERLRSIEASLKKAWKPIRPRPAFSVLLASLLAEFIAVAVLLSLYLGTRGLQNMTVADSVLDLGILVLASAGVAGIALARLIPGMRVPARAAVIVLISTAALVLITWVLFPSLNIQSFLLGRSCLETGCVASAVAAVAFLPLVRYGLLPSSVGSSALVGFLCGLFGVCVLAIHCGWHTTPHILVWHFGVLGVTTAAAAFIAWITQRIRTRKFHARP